MLDAELPALGLWDSKEQLLARAEQGTSGHVDGHRDWALLGGTAQCMMMTVQQQSFHFHGAPEVLGCSVSDFPHSYLYSMVQHSLETHLVHWTQKIVAKTENSLARPQGKYYRTQGSVDGCFVM